MKAVFCVLAVFLCTLGSGFAQQITRFGVVDTAKVYSAYYKNSSQVRGYEKKKSEAQEEINKRTEELRALKTKRAQTADETQQGLLDQEIAQKTQYLNEYATAKNAELERLRQSMQGSDAFYKRLYAVIGKVAEQGGYSAILSLQEAGGILWYSPSVDVTEDVIKALGK